MNTVENLNIPPLVHHIEKSADRVWSAIRPMDNLHKFSSQIDTVEWVGPKDVGGERIMQGREQSNHFREIITSFSDVRRSYGYEVVEGVPARKLTNTISIIDQGYNNCLIIWTSECGEFLPGLGLTIDQFSGFLTQARQEILDNLVASL